MRLLSPIGTPSEAESATGVAACNRGRASELKSTTADIRVYGRVGVMAEIQWWYAHADEQFGPVSAADLRLLAATGDLAPGDLVWREGLAEWTPAARLKGLFPEAPAAPVEPATAGAAPNKSTPSKSAPPTGASPLAAPSPAGVRETAELPPSAMFDPVAESFTVVEPPAGVPPIEIPPPAPQAALAPAPAPIGASDVSPSEQRQGISHSHLARILSLVQIALWSICVLVILLGGLFFTWARLCAKTPADEAASAAAFATFFIGAYVVARAGEKISRLVLSSVENRRRGS